MYTIRIRLISYILLMGHSLMSCYNPDLVRDEQRLTNRIQVEKEEEVLRISQEERESPQAPCKQSVSLSSHLIALEQEYIKAPKLTSSTKTKEAPSLPGASGQAQKPLSITTNLFQGPVEPGEKETLQLAKDKPGSIANNQVNKQNHFFHPLHPILTNRQGCQLQFTAPDLQAAEVKDLDGRAFHLPVFKEDPSLNLEQVMAKGEEWRKYHLHVTFPEQDPANKGYVYVGTRGLMGGGGTYSRGWEEHILLACRSCKKAIKTQLVWVEGYGMNPDNGSPHRWVDKCDACKNWDKWMEQLRQKVEREKREEEKRAREKREAEERERIERARKERIEMEKKRLEELRKKQEEENSRKAAEERERVSQQTNSNSSSKNSSNHSSSGKGSNNGNRSGKSKSGTSHNRRNNRISRPSQASKKSRSSSGGRGFWNRFKGFFRSAGSFFRGLGQSYAKVRRAISGWASGVGRKVFSSIHRIGRYVSQSVRQIASRLATFAKKLANQTWEWMKKAGKWIWKHKWPILIVIGIIAAIALVWWLIPASGAASGVGAASGGAAKGAALKTFFAKLGSTLLTKGTSLWSSIQHYGAPVLEFVKGNLINLTSIAWKYKEVIAGGLLLDKLAGSIVDLIDQIPHAFPTPSANLPAEHGKMEQASLNTNEEVLSTNQPEGITQQQAVKKQEVKKHEAESNKLEEDKGKQEKEEPQEATTSKNVFKPKQDKVGQQGKASKKENPGLFAQRDKLAQELNQKLEDSLQEISQERENVNQKKEEIEDIIQEEKGYEEIAQGLTSPEFTHEVAQESQQVVKDLLSQGEQSKGQAQELAEGLADQIGPLLSIKQKLEVTASLTSVGSALQEIHQQLIQVEKRIDKLQAALKELCEKFNLPMPDLTATPPISKEAIKKALGHVLDVTVPGSELIKILSGLSDSPQSQEGWLKLAADTALDFMPGGKILKFLKGNAARLGIKQIENQLLKIAAKKTGKRIKTQWGWTGSKIWKDLLSKVKKGGTIENLLGKIPTKDEAIKLIEAIGGKIQRIEGAHFPPNPHSYPHINYTTPTGIKGTIRIQ